MNDDVEPEQPPEQPPQQPEFEPEHPGVELQRPETAPDDGGWNATPTIAESGGVPFVAHDTMLLGGPAPTSTSSPSAASYPAAGTSPAYQPRQRRPVNRKVLFSVLGGALALVLIVVLGSVGYASGARDHAPARQVEAFLDDLKAGHAEKALALSHTSTKGQPLLTDAVYAKATGTISSYRIAGTTTNSSTDTADVSVVLTQAGQPMTQTFHLRKTGKAGLFFSNWRLEDLTLGSVEVTVDGPDGTPVRVAGVDVPTTKGGASLEALPGTYDTAVADSKWFTAKTSAANVAGFTPGAFDPVELRTTLTDAGTQAATDAVNGWVDGCIAQTDIQPAGCSFYAYGESAENTYTDQKWTLDTRPVAEVGEWSGTGWTISTTTPGAATFTANFTGPSGSGTGTAGPITFYADGTITGFTDAGATFAAAVAALGGGDADS